MTNFKAEDFDGSGQYLIRNNPDPDKIIKDTGYLSTVLIKVVWCLNPKRCGLCDMSDGWTRFGYHEENEDGDKIFHEFNTKEDLVEFLNKNSSTEYRFATHEEFMRVALYQKSRVSDE